MKIFKIFRCKNLLNLFGVNDLILVLNDWLIPEDLTTIVALVEYPIPGFITITSVNLPSDITGLNLAPFPEPLILISGSE